LKSGQEPVFEVTDGYVKTVLRQIKGHFGLVKDAQNASIKTK
jgi:hypothetical protein